MASVLGGDGGDFCTAGTEKKNQCEQCKGFFKKKKIVEVAIF
jgi:hypothetical protein